MKEIQHPQYGQCYELTQETDIAFSRMAQSALVNATVLPSGMKTPPTDLWIRKTYLVTREHAPEGAPYADH